MKKAKIINKDDDIIINGVRTTALDVITKLLLYETWSNYFDKEDKIYNAIIKGEKLYTQEEINNYRNII